MSQLKMASTSSSLHCSSSSQETTDTVCLACGKEAVARERRKLESQPGISALLTGLLLRRYGDTGDGVIMMAQLILPSTLDLNLSFRSPICVGSALNHIRGTSGKKNISMS